MKRRTLLTGAAALTAYQALPAKALVGGAGKALLSAKPVANTTQIGSILTRSSWADLSAFNITGSTWSTSAGAITFVGAGNAGFSSNLQLKLSSNTDENTDFYATMQAITLGASAFGMGLGRATTNTITANGSSVTGQIQTSGNPNTIILYPYGSGTTVTNHIAGPNNCTGAVMAANDIIILHLQQRGPTYTFTCTNTTSGVINSITATGNWNAVGGQNNFLPNDVAGYNIYGFATTETFHITSITITSASLKYPKVMCIGDSKTQGYDALLTRQRWGNLLNAQPSATWAGQADKTADVLTALPYILLNTKPEYVVLNIGRNDLAAAIATGTWQANYASIVSQLKTAGVRVVHLLPIPETAQVQTTLTTYINATYPNDPRVDVTPQWTNAANLAADNIHPNVSGHALIANQLNNSGYLT